MADILTLFFGRATGRPWSLALVLSSLVLPASLTLLVARPDLFFNLGFPLVLLVSAALSLPVILGSTMLCYSPLSYLAHRQREANGVVDPTEIAQLVQQDDPLEVPSLLMGAALANLMLYSIAIAAYLRPISLGRTYLAVMLVIAAVLAAELLVFVAVALRWPIEAPESSASAEITRQGDMQ
jgi:hypothetical protein